MEIKTFIGIDVSKQTLDISVVVEAKQILHQRISNTSRDIKSSMSKIMKGTSASFENTVFCMEYTGIYNLPLLKWLQGNHAVNCILHT